MVVPSRSWDFGTVQESRVMDISLGNMKDAPQTGMEDSLEASEWWSDDCGLKRKEGRLEGKWYWNRAGEAFRRQQVDSRPFIG